MLTRIEIDGFKSFEDFSLDLQPLTAIVGPNASGKSNLFDALRFLSLLAQFDIRTAMQDLRGEPLELFRQTVYGPSDTMKFAVELMLDRSGVDAFGTRYETPARRLRYELILRVAKSQTGIERGVYVHHEKCTPISKQEDRALFLRHTKLTYNSLRGRLAGSPGWTAEAWSPSSALAQRGFQNRALDNHNRRIPTPICCP
jgi:hypothetical protein